MVVVKSIGLAAVAAAFVGSAAQAIPITLTDAVIDRTGGDTLTYGFTGLPNFAAGDGLLTVATTGVGNAGIDLGDSVNEYMDVVFDGVDLGRFECGAANDGGTLIPGASDGAPNEVGNQCLFSLSLSIPESTLVSAISDGIVNVDLVMGSQVAAFPLSPGNDEIAVTLDYEPAVIPLPASVPLLLAGIAALGFVGSRRARG